MPVRADSTCNAMLWPHGHVAAVQAPPRYDQHALAADLARQPYSSDYRHVSFVAHFTRNEPPEEG